MEDNNAIYVFIRQDLPVKMQAIQAMHAVDFMRRTFGGAAPEHPKIIALDGGASAKSLARIGRKLNEMGINHFCYTDPDFSLGLAAIATVPVSPYFQEHIRQYRTWKLGEGTSIVEEDSADVAQCRAPDSNQGAAGFNSRPSAPISEPQR